MLKIIEKKEGTILIGYWQDSDGFQSYLDNESLDPIKIQFIPKKRMHEQEFTAFSNSLKNQIVEEIKLICRENNEIYKNFVYDLTQFDFTGFSLSSKQNKFSVINCHTNLKYIIIKGEDTNNFQDEIIPISFLIDTQKYNNKLPRLCSTSWPLSSTKTEKHCHFASRLESAK